MPSSCGSIQYFLPVKSLSLSLGSSKKLALRQSSVYTLQWKFLTNYSSGAFPSVNCWLIGLNPAEARREEMLFLDFKLLLGSPPLRIRRGTSYMNSCTVALSPLRPCAKTPGLVS